MSIQGPNPPASAELDSTQNPRNIIQKLVEASADQRTNLMGNVSQLRKIFSLIQDLWADMALCAEDVAETLEAYPNIDNILSQPHHLKQLALNASKNEPGLYDCAHPDVTHEHYHENIFILQKVVVVYEFLEQYLKPSDEFADVFGHIKLDLMDKHINLFQHYSRFGLKGSFDAEYKEASLSLFERQKHIGATCAIYEKNRSILDEALALKSDSNNALLKKMQLYLWSMHFGAMESYYASIILAHNLKDEALLKESMGKFEDVIQHLGRNIISICKYANKDVSDCIKTLIEYKSHIARISSRVITPSSLELSIKNMYCLLEEKALTSGVELKDVAYPSLDDILAQIKMLMRHVESQSTPKKLEALFSRHLEMTQVIYQKNNGEHEVLAITTLMRTWIKWLVSQMPQVDIKYLELNYESIYLINRSLRSRLSSNIPEGFIGEVTNSVKELEFALRLKDFSPDSLVAWIGGDDVEGGVKRSKQTKQTKGKKGKRSESQPQEKYKTALEAKAQSKSQSQVKDSTQKSSSSDTSEAEDSLSDVFQALKLDSRATSTTRTEGGWINVVRGRKGKSKNDQQGQEQQRHKHKNNNSRSENREGAITVSKQESVSHGKISKPSESAILVSKSREKNEDNAVIASKILTDTAVDVIEKKYPVAGQLQLALPLFAQEVMARLNQAGKENYIYGGCVRDNLLQKPYNDIDLVADCDEDMFKVLFPHAKKEQMLIDKIVYNLSATLSVTLELGLDLEAFSGDRYLAVNALFANSKGEILDPLGVMASALAPELKPILGRDIISAYKADPSRMLRTIRYSTHLQRMWDAEIHQALTVCGHMLNRLPFGKFLNHVGELFLRGSGETHLHVLLNLGMLSSISLPLGSDWAKYIDEKSISFNFMKHELAQIDKYPVKHRTAQNRLYLLTLFLLPSLEKIRLINDDSESTYSAAYLKSTIEKVLEQFFVLYDGEIKVADKRVKQHQIFTLMEQVIWPKFLNYRRYYVQQNYYLAAMNAPPQSFYKPVDVIDDQRVLPSPISGNITPLYQSYTQGGTTFYSRPSLSSNPSSGTNVSIKQ